LGEFLYFKGLYVFLLETTNTVIKKIILLCKMNMSISFTLEALNLKTETFG